MTKVPVIVRRLFTTLVALVRSAKDEVDQMTGGLMTRLCLAYRDESGGVAEKVVIVAIFVALAIAAGTIIYDKVITKANSINLG